MDLLNDEVVDRAARAAYAAYCNCDPLDAERQPDWGRTGYKAEAGVWQAVAAAAVAAALRAHSVGETR